MPEADDPIVTLTRNQYNELVRADRILSALYSYGVDNWEGYAEAIQAYHRAS